MTQDPMSSSAETGSLQELRPPRVLVVDDEPDACANLRDILCEFGYHADIATSGLAALDLAHQFTYDIALLDLKMPHMDGLTLYRRLKQLSPNTIAVIVTAYSGELRLAALPRGIDVVCYKPVDVDSLLNTIGQLSPGRLGDS